MNKYEYSGISWEAKILTNELFKATKKHKAHYKMHNIIYSPNKVATLILCILSNHNNLNYYLTRAKQRYDEYCEFCTKVMKHCDL